MWNIEGLYIPKVIYSSNKCLIQVFSNLCFSLYPKAVKLEATVKYSSTSVLGIKMKLKIKQGAANKNLYLRPQINTAFERKLDGLPTAARMATTAIP